MVEHPQSAHVHRVVVAASLGSTIQSIVLHARQHVLVASHLRTIGPSADSFIATHHCSTHQTSEVRVFAVALCSAPPAGIHTDVHHRREGPVDAVGSGLLGSDACCRLCGLFVPRAGKGQRNGEDRLVAVDNIHADDERYAQSALFDGDVLQFANLVGPLQVEHTAHLSCGNLRPHVGVHRTARDDVARHLQVQLPNLLLQRHLRHQRVNILLHRHDGFCLFLSFLLRPSCHRQQAQQCPNRYLFHIRYTLFQRMLVLR